MVSIGIGSSAGKAWWPDGAVMALDFSNRRYMRDRQAADLSTVMSFSRASSKMARNRAGMLVSFATDVPAITDAGLSVEPAATNSGLYSTQFDNGWWSKDNTSVLPDVARSPTGNMDADKVVASGAGNLAHGFYRSGQSPFSTQRVFAKAGELQWLAVRHGGVDTWFDLGTGTIGAVGASRTAAIIPFADGWYLCQVINTATPNGGYTYRLGIADNSSSFVADGVSGLYLWGSEARVGTHPATSSPIGAEGSIGARAADVVDLHLPPVATNILATYEDGTTQAMTGVSGTFRLPSDLGRPVVKSIAAFP